MSLPIRTLPIEQRWDCHACGLCCRGTIIPLGGEELGRLREQGWHEHPDFRGVKIVERCGLLWRGRRLVHRRDGNCVFLTPEGRCRIHEDFGEPAKPHICRMFPFQLVPLEEFAYLTLRHYCPSAAANQGRKLDEYLATVRELAEARKRSRHPTTPPAVIRGHRRSWQDMLRVAEVIDRMMLDERFPLVRRLVHALEFCKLLDMCRLRKLSSEKLASLLTMLETSALDEAQEVFAHRRPPRRLAAGLFRQIAFDYVRLHPKLKPERSLRQRVRLIRSTLAFARGKGRVPPIHADFPATTFEALERPLGHLGVDVLGPLNRYFEIATLSKQYAMLGRRQWSLTESFRALAMAYPVAMWMLRLSCGPREPTTTDVIDVVGAIDRGQGYAPLCGRRHRVRLKTTARLGALPRLVAWYAR